MKVFFAINSEMKNEIHKNDRLDGNNWLLREDTVVGPCICLSSAKLYDTLKEYNKIIDDLIVCEAEVQDKYIVEAIEASLSEDSTYFPVRVIDAVVGGVKSLDCTEYNALFGGAIF